MDVRAVLIPLCVLFTQAPCKPAWTGNKVEDVNQTISLALEGIRVAWGHLDDALPVENCSSWNIPESVGLRQVAPSATRLSNASCYMQKLFKLNPELLELLRTPAQFIQDAEQRLSGNSTGPAGSCSLPEFKQPAEAYEFAMCLLERVLEERPRMES